MSEKRSFPLNNPLQEKNNNSNPGVVKVREREKGGSKGGKERARPAEALLKCLMCGRIQKAVFPVGRPPEYHKCIWCNQVQPADGYRVIAYGLGLPQPLAPHELKVQQQRFER